jgi:response regulator RpfG family c-di-GMP phosphodiesterase
MWRVGVFAPMHDIGKVGIMDSILLAERKLTSAERAEMESPLRRGRIGSSNELYLFSGSAIFSHG